MRETQFSTDRCDGPLEIDLCLFFVTCSETTAKIQHVGSTNAYGTRQTVFDLRRQRYWAVCGPLAHAVYHRHLFLLKRDVSALLASHCRTTARTHQVHLFAKNHITTCAFWRRHSAPSHKPLSSMAEVHAGSVAKPRKGQAKGGLLRFLTKFMPTNYNMVRKLGCMIR